jgi:hypothetical protein
MSRMMGSRTSLDIQDGIRLNSFFGTSHEFKGSVYNDHDDVLTFVLLASVRVEERTRDLISTDLNQ